MKKAKKQAKRQSGSIFSTEERNNRIAALEEERQAINEQLAEAVALFRRETGDAKISLPNSNLNGYLVDGAAIGTEAFDEESVSERFILKK